MKHCKPKVTKLVYNIVDPPWNFYSICYELDGHAEHIVYIPTKVIAAELETKSIVEIILEKLRAELACVPEHIDRVTKEDKNATKRRAIEATRKSKNKLAQPTARDGKLG